MQHPRSEVDDVTLYYQDALVTLYHGDCLTEHLEWCAADILVTDPPYGIRWRGYADTGDGIAGDENVQTRDQALTLWGEKPRIVFGSWRASHAPILSTTD